MTDIKNVIHRFFNIYYLLILLLVDIIHAHFFKIWSGDSGWYWFILGLLISISVVFWIVISLLSHFKKATLKGGVIYFLIIGILQIAFAIDYYKFHIIKDLPLFEWLFYLIYFLPIVICILPYFNIWKFHNKLKESR